MNAAALRIPLLFRGKVRDVYDLGGRLLVVATDRLSAFDCVLPTPVPDRGKVLTQLSAFWFSRTTSLIPNHLITTDLEAIAEALGEPVEALAALRDRTMLVWRAERLPFECVVRGYLAGSGWRDYVRTGAVCGIQLPRGLREGERLPEPIFTPATKNETGHDENVSFEVLAEAVGEGLAARLREVSLSLYRFLHDAAYERGLILADSKFEFGLRDGRLLLIDELGTPDSSRYWDREAYEARGERTSFDKQFVRDYLEEIGWDKRPPAPPLPPEVVEATRARYLEAYRRITGQVLPWEAR
ncbi:MAG: phosphoribosylaminoimidazolesuccinocarboxamide synthase [Armatimonadetes bacterium]|nr:phosphoribosylaminoimidazolesuccinocarboxamide synthase [Armatimonadota bacterium]MDW8152614.1 phosphoribosylaminoimidazolesuccinocarboxamide synthase [Armatimonadota bacterium]